MNRRFIMFKKAIETKEADRWADYKKKLRNKITSDIRKARTAYFGRKSILATNPKARKPIGLQYSHQDFALGSPRAPSSEK